MAVSYRKLWIQLINRNMKKTDLRKASGITTNALAKLGRDETVTTDVINKICLTLNCNVEDIMEIIPDDEYLRRRGDSAAMNPANRNRENAG